MLNAGGYRDLLCYRKALIVYDATVKNSREALFVSRLGRSPNESYETYRTYIETRPANVVANIIICLVHQAHYLLDHHLRHLEKAFVKEGDLRERMTKARLDERARRTTSFFS